MLSGIIKGIKPFIFLFIFLSASYAVAGDVQLEVTVDRNQAALGEALRLDITFHGKQNISAPELGETEGFNIRYLGPSTMVSIVNGVVTSSITHMYTLLPLKTGKYNIGPFSIELDGKTLTSDLIAVEVLAANSTARSSAQQQVLQDSSAEKIDSKELRNNIFLVLSADKSKAYLNENIPLVLKLYVNQLGVRDIQFPVLETNDFSVEKFGQPKQYREQWNGVLYDVIEFATDMFGIKPGEFILGPARLKCNLVVRRQNQNRRNLADNDPFSGFFKDDIFDNFFGRYEAYPLELESEGLPLAILSLPQDGKPDSFDGALGSFKLEVQAAPLEVKAGDPITLKMTVRGAGNFDSVKAPSLQTEEGFKVYDPQVKQEEAKKIFEQVLIPDSEKIASIPGVIFSFFNVDTGQYQVLTHEPIPIIVTRSEEAQTKLVEFQQAQTKVAQKEELGRDILYLKNSLGDLKNVGCYLYDNFVFWSIQIISSILFLGFIAAFFRKKRLKNDIRYARRLQAPSKAKKGIQEAEEFLRKGKTEVFFNAIFRTIRGYFADRFHLSSGGITSSTIEEVGKKEDIPEEVLIKIKGIFADCDMARYASSQFSQAQLEGIFESLKEVIDYLERHRR